MADTAEALDRQARLVRALLDPTRYPHPVDSVEHIETHISHVLLAGDYVYKIKKPLDLGFLDFTRLADRAYYCEEEVRLNGRLAPEIYLRAVPIAGGIDDPRIGQDGEPIEYAVLMRRFAQEALLDRRFARGEVGIGFMDTLADRLAAFHASAARADPESHYGSPEIVIAPMRENFAHIGPLVADADTRDRLDGLADWTEQRFRALGGTLARRKSEGFVRECHGDMHLANMALPNGDLIIFDGIEFNPALRWIDVMSELAFLTMDLDERGAAGHANRLLNRYLEQTGDYAGLELLRFYQVYRCLVRAKVNAIRASQDGISEQEVDAAWDRFGRYLDRAEGYTRSETTRLILTHGFSGSGKTTVAQALVDAYGYIRLRSDIERKRLYGFAAEARSGSNLGAGIYTGEATQRTYAHLAQLAEYVLRAGFPAIVDAAFLKREQRVPFASLAKRMDTALNILDVHAAREVMEARIRRRHAEARDASEADLRVLAHQIETAEPLTPAELAVTFRVDAGEPLRPETLAGLAPGAAQDRHPGGAV